MLNRQGRPSSAGEAGTNAHPTFTGNKALAQIEPLIFEIGHHETTGVDLDEPEAFTPRLGGLERKDAIGLPGLSEPEAMRHYVRLSQMNYGIDTGLFPLGSCTMKHNARLNERMARLPGFSDVHPLQPVSTVRGALEVMDELSRYLVTLTNTTTVALSPKAGAHGELCGMMAIKAAIEAKGEGKTRNVVLVPDSAHGTNPATAALIGFTVRPVPARDDGWVHVEDVKKLLGPDVAAIMLTNPNTCGLFENQVDRDRQGDPRCGRVFLLRRRQLQRHRGQGAAGRSRHRRHAHQPAQDLLDAPWRRRPGLRSGGALRASRAFRARAVRHREGWRADAGRGGEGCGRASRSAA